VVPYYPVSTCKIAHSSDKCRTCCKNESIGAVVDAVQECCRKQGCMLMFASVAAVPSHTDYVVEAADEPH
jgi:hypothetical protein